MFRGGEVPFNPKTDVADYGNFKEGFCSMKLIQKSDIRVQDMFFLTIVLRKIKTRQTLKKALVVIPYFGYSGAIKVELELQKFDNMNINGLSDGWKYPCLSLTMCFRGTSSFVFFCFFSIFQLVLVP